MVLSQEEIEKCREAFERFDKDGSGTIDAWELKETLKVLAFWAYLFHHGIIDNPRHQAMGQNPSDEEVFQMLNEVDDDGSGGIEFPEFLKVIDSQKAKLASDHDESDMIDAFVAMGGCADRSGNIEAEKLRRTIKAFELTIDIERLIKEVLLWWL
jgi:calmodulin